MKVLFIFPHFFCNSRVSISTDLAVFYTLDYNVILFKNLFVPQCICHWPSGSDSVGVLFNIHFKRTVLETETEAPYQALLLECYFFQANSAARRRKCVSAYDTCTQACLQFFQYLIINVYIKWVNTYWVSAHVKFTKSSWWWYNMAWETAWTIEHQHPASIPLRSREDLSFLFWTLL